MWTNRIRLAFNTNDLEVMQATVLAWDGTDYVRSNNLDEVLYQLRRGNKDAAAFCMRQAPDAWSSYVPTPYMGGAKEFEFDLAVLYLQCFPGAPGWVVSYLTNQVGDRRVAACKHLLDNFTGPPADLLVGRDGWCHLADVLSISHSKVLCGFLDAGLCPNWSTPDGETLLRMCLRNHSRYSAVALVQRGARVAAEDLLEAVCVPVEPAAALWWQSMLCGQDTRALLNAPLQVVVHNARDYSCPPRGTSGCTVLGWAVLNRARFSWPLLDSLLPLADAQGQALLRRVLERDAFTLADLGRV